MADTRYSALVLAATRGGPRDPLAQAGGVSHKAFIDLAGTPMLRRVVEGVIDSGRVRHVIVSIEAEAIEEAKQVLAGLAERVPITYTPSRESIGASAAAVEQDFPDSLPLVITTADNGLHTGAIIAAFCEGLDASRADSALGLTDARLVMERYPEGARAFHRFRDGAYSSCNLYAFLGPGAFRGTRVFDTGGQFGKKPRRLIATVGLLAFVVYKSRLMKVRPFLRFMSRVVGLTVDPIFLPFAEGPVDIDRMSDWQLAERILREREGTAA